MGQLETPVVLFGFNRPDLARDILAAVREARPTRLFVVVDGPRADRAGEAELCAEVRKALTAVDWPCEVKTNFAETNMGCRRRIISGMNWVFEQVEEAILLEDDCVPDASFFPYCAELLERYRETPEVAYIAGFNPLEKELACPWSYAFSNLVSMWGWATWRRAWRAYDEHLTTWPEAKAKGLVRRQFPQRRAAAYWTEIFDRMHAGTGPNTWDYQWAYTCWLRNWLAVVPSRNLVRNVGAGERATHTRTLDRGLMLPARAMAFPLKHPPAVTPWPEQSRRMQDRFFSPPLWVRAVRKIGRLLGSQGR